MKSKLVILVVAVVAILFVFTAAYVVDETEQVVVTQFGKVVGQPKKEPGLYFKIPFIQNATYFPRNLLEWDGDPGQIPTLDKTYIWVDTFARWRIIDPIKFFQTVNNTTSAQGRLDDIIDPAVRNLITENRLIETVRKTNREMDIYEIGLEDIKERPTYIIQIGREEITKRILEQAQPKLAKFGIELVDVKIKRINYVEEVRKSVYGRMIAERKQIAEKFRSEGKGEAKKILGDVSCIVGNIPSSVVMKGTAKQVTELCRDVIEKCAPGGGYILAGGASIDKGKIENLKAMMDAAKEYGVY